MEFNIGNKVRVKTKISKYNNKVGVINSITKGVTYPYYVMFDKGLCLYEKEYPFTKNELELIVINKQMVF